MPDLKSELKKKFNFNDVNAIRLFNQQGKLFISGVEIFEDDLEFCKDGMSLYVSKGNLIN